MEEKQAKQIEIVKSALKEHRAAVVFIHEEVVGLAQKLVHDVNAFEVLSGKSDLMMAAIALMSIAQQVESIIPECDE